MEVAQKLLSSNNNSSNNQGKNSMETVQYKSNINHGLESNKNAGGHNNP